MNRRGWAARAAFGFLLVSILCCAARAGAQAGGARVFRGWVGRYPVQMTLRRGAGGELTGSYSYEGREGSLALKGALDARGNFTLAEFDGAKQTGIFQGRWREREYEPEATIEGDWKKPGGGGEQTFYLAEQLGGGARLTSRRVREQNKTRRYSIDAAYPQVEGAEQFNRLVEGFVTREVGEFRKGAGVEPGEAGEAADAPEDSLNINYNVRLATDEFLSVEFVVSSYEHGAAHPSQAYNTVNFDRRAGRRLELADLFRPGADYLRVISSAAVARLRRWSTDTGAEPGAGDGEPALNDEEMLEGASPKPDNYKNWTLTPRGLAVTFEPYQVGPYAIGAPAVLIPYAEFRAVARPGGPLERLAK